MLRFLSRFLGYWLMAAALVTAVVDGAKSIAASAIVLTPVSEAVAALGDPAAAPPLAGGGPPFNVLFAWLLAAPLVAVLAALGILFLLAGRKRRSFAISREFAT